MTLGHVDAMMSCGKAEGKINERHRAWRNAKQLQLQLQLGSEAKIHRLSTKKAYLRLGIKHSYDLKAGFTFSSSPPSYICKPWRVLMRPLDWLLRSRGMPACISATFSRILTRSQFFHIWRVF
jgi:hypothetical protein